MEVLQRPGGELATRPIHFFWVVDCSGSMYGEKIGIVNNTIQECIPEMRSAADNNPTILERINEKALDFYEEIIINMNLLWDCTYSGRPVELLI